MRLVSFENYECRYASPQELKTYPCLEKDFHFIEFGSITFQGYTIDDFRGFAYKNAWNHVKTNSFVYDYVLNDKLNELKYCTILDTPKCAKIELKDSKVCPVILMRLTSDGNNASLVYFIMAEFCNWSKDPDSKFYDKDYYPRFETIGLGLFNWKERPFSEIYERIKDMKKITFVNTPNEPSEYDTSTSKNVMCFFK